MPRLARDHALTVAQAFAIVEGRPLDSPPTAFAGSGIYLGLAAALVIVGFGFTIVIKRAATPYVVVDPNDDV
jgi:hypothetical protein